MFCQVRAMRKFRHWWVRVQPRGRSIKIPPFGCPHVTTGEAGRHLRFSQRYCRRFQDLCHVRPCRLGEWDRTFRRMLAFPSSGSSRLGLRPFAMSGSKLRARRQRVAAQHLNPDNGVLTSQPAECHRRLCTKTHVSCASG